MAAGRPARRLAAAVLLFGAAGGLLYLPGRGRDGATAAAAAGSQCTFFVYNLSRAHPGMGWAERFEPGDTAGFTFPETRRKFPDAAGCPDCYRHTHPYNITTCCFDNREQRPPEPPSRWTVPHHHLQTPRAFHRRVLLHPRRTSDPSRASLYFVPMTSEHWCCSSRGNWEHLSAITDVMRRQNPAFDSTRDRHFVALGRTSDMYSSLARSTHYRGTWLEAATKYVSEVYPGDDPTWRPLPYFSYSGPWKEGRKLPMHTGTRRRLLASASFQNRMTQTILSGRLRHWLTKQCQDSADCGGWFQKDQGEQPAADTLRMYRNSVFVLSPTGDSYARSATIDALLQGAIPVLFHRSSFPWVRQVPHPERVALFLSVVDSPN
eukprot:TRINITY_DN14605_c0_g1_i4.p1 TRINITY_DN14605_c0_g1~~TRINITY_DN14605_c0_g1_i4.p1  ORF type:complete len:391 (+),score=94.79 TRINITY_DN14605_c0_g1_i4:44-1174(+)